MSIIRDSYKKYPFSWLYAILGNVSLILGVLVMDEMIELKEDLMIEEIYGLLIVILAAFLIITSYLTYRIDRLQLQTDHIERDQKLQDLQEGKE